jgi:hypothetical protein
MRREEGVITCLDRPLALTSASDVLKEISQGFSLQQATAVWRMQQGV